MSNGFTLIVPSLHNNLAGHLRMNRAKVRITSRLAKGERELLIRVEYFGLEHTLRADHRVGNVVTIGPRNSGSHRHRQRSRPETEVVNLHFRGFRFLLSASSEISCSGAQPGNSQPQRHQQNCSRHTSPHGTSPFLFCIWTSENSCLCLVDFHTSEESVTASASQYCFRQNDFIGEIHCSRPKLVNGSENRCSFIFDKKYDEPRWFRLTRVTAYGMNVFR